ncbi:hypothetical protein ZIOFF_023024 [Zingiber officinale]|uniref:Exostosin GT47 domain-containing protein n=1 Tax=Zingiber officinale TaxID=94328 RepID=A0A8J5LHS3_ZINOF|nr:hypothetical protein ZIOFF_023024 [Zingiber officinale]
MASMRLRPPASKHQEETKKKANGKSPPTRLCFLATLSVMFWIMIFYFHFVVLNSNLVRIISQAMLAWDLHSRMPKESSQTLDDSSIAASVFVPFYAGFDIARYLWGYNISHRDAASLELVDWLVKRPEWSGMGGKDHFLVAGRITWDFRRLTDTEKDWGNKLLFLPAARNMSMLVVEASPWNANDYGIPYPSYFHPAKDEDVFVWQNRIRKLERKYLFSFAGDNPKSIRGQIIDQCRSSMVCKLLECDVGESKCHSPSSIMRMFQNSLFCLQPQADFYPRRSAFDRWDGQRTVGAHEWDPFFSKPKDANGDSGSSSTEAAQNSWRNEQMSET